MKIISYTDINGKKCYADVEKFAATMSERIVEDPTHPDEARMIWYTKVKSRRRLYSRLRRPRRNQPKNSNSFRGNVGCIVTL